MAYEKNRIKVYFLIIISFFTFCRSFSQFYNTGSAPGNTQWKIIRAPSCRIIFPAPAQKEGISFARLTDYVSDSISSDMNLRKKRPVDIILYNQNVLSNGYVALAPRRMEIISIPPQETYPQPWLQQLALHEYRHVAQLEKTDVGFTHALSYLSGDMAVGAASAFLPFWFFEGDAVYNETRYSHSGRGREPSFDIGLRALELRHKKRYSYDQAYLGTYRTLLPDYYAYGYQMVNWAYKKYGQAFWPSVVENVGRHPYTIAPFYFGMKKQGGLSKTSLYDSTFNYLSKQWNSALDSTPPTKFCQIDIKRSKTPYEDYRFPYLACDSTIFAFHSSIDRNCKLVSITNSNEKTLYTIGGFHVPKPAYSCKYIAWEETRYGPRWEQCNWSVIRIYDINKHKSFILSKHIRQFSPAIDSSASRIAVIRIDISNNYFIDIYNISTKHLLKSIPITGSLQLSYLTWTGDSSLATVAICPKGNFLAQINLNDNNITALTGPDYYTISNIDYADKNLFYTGTYDGRQNIYRLNIKTKSIARITSSATGADFAKFSTGTGKLLLSEYTTSGYRIRLINENQFENKPVGQIEDAVPRTLANPHKALGYRLNNEGWDSTKYKVQPYSKLLHAFHFHSWFVPFYFDVFNLINSSELNYPVFPGFNLLSQNILSTVTSSIGYYYKDGYHHFRPSIYLKAFYPIISFDADFGGPPIQNRKIDTLVAFPGQLQNNITLNSSISVPYRFSTSRFLSAITPSIKVSYDNIYIITDSVNTRLKYKYRDKDIYYYQGLYETKYNLGYYIYSRTAYRNLYPRWGTNILISINDISNNNKNHKSWESKLVSSIFYMPGLFSNHSVILRAGYENGLADRLILPRGFDKAEFKRTPVSERFSAEYAMPVAYPDLSLGPVIYIKRLKASIFYDYMHFNKGIVKGIDSGSFQSLSSTGVNLGFDVNLLRFFPGLSPTINYYYRISDGESRLGFIIKSNYNFSLGKL